ncbi:hypothetical protein H5U35_03560 [Candidatus Aerophobetes bacterium]|nr:hypothetical protein [Candidatus Aerophobetes bacterium]
MDKRKLGREVKIFKPSKEDIRLLKKHLNDFCSYFKLELKNILEKPFIKLSPSTTRPYGKIYAY